VFGITLDLSVEVWKDNRQTTFRLPESEGIFAGEAWGLKAALIQRGLL
jgi:hypothetical protein